MIKKSDIVNYENEFVKVISYNTVPVNSANGQQLEIEVKIENMFVGLIYTLRAKTLQQMYDLLEAETEQIKAECEDFSDKVNILKQAGFFK